MWKRCFSPDGFLWLPVLWGTAAECVPSGEPASVDKRQCLYLEHKLTSPWHKKKTLHHLKCYSDSQKKAVKTARRPKRVAYVRVIFASCLDWDGETDQEGKVSPRGGVRRLEEYQQKEEGLIASDKSRIWSSKVLLINWYRVGDIFVTFSVWTFQTWVIIF